MTAKRGERESPPPSSSGSSLIRAAAYGRTRTGGKSPNPSPKTDLPGGLVKIPQPVENRIPVSIRPEQEHLLGQPLEDIPDLPLRARPARAFTISSRRFSGWTQHARDCGVVALAP